MAQLHTEPDHVHLSNFPKIEDDVPGLCFDATPPARSSLPQTPGDVDYLTNRYTLGNLPSSPSPCPRKTSDEERKLIISTPGTSGIPAATDAPNDNVATHTSRPVFTLPSFPHLPGTAIKNNVSSQLLEGSVVLDPKSVDCNFSRLQGNNNHPAKRHSSTAIPHKNRSTHATTTPATKSTATKHIASAATQDESSMLPGTVTSCNMEELGDFKRRATCVVTVTDANPHLARILPYDTMLRLLTSGTCIACTKNGSKGKPNVHRRCGNAQHWNSATMRWIFDWLLKFDGPYDLITVAPLVERILDDAVSNSAKHRTRAKENLRSLLKLCKASSRQQRDDSWVPKSGGFTVGDLTAIPGWIAALTLSTFTSQGGTNGLEHREMVLRALIAGGPERVDSNNFHIEFKVTYSLSIGAEKVSKATSANTATALRQKFVPFLKSPADFAKDVSTALREVFYRPLGIMETEHSGLIYVYWSLGNFGYVKIGLTGTAPGRTIRNRLEEWQKDCGHDLECHQNDSDPGQGPLSIEVAHVYRVEKFIHTELRLQRRRECECKGCGGNHKEWFEVDADHARNVALKWVNFMREHQEAYEELLADGVPMDKSLVESLCTPLEISASRSSDSMRRQSTPSMSQQIRKTQKSGVPLRRSKRLQEQQSRLQSSTVDGQAIATRLVTTVASQNTAQVAQTPKTEGPQEHSVSDALEPKPEVSTIEIKVEIKQLLDSVSEECEQSSQEPAVYPTTLKSGSKPGERGDLVAEVGKTTQVAC